MIRSLAEINMKNLKQLTFLIFLLAYIPFLLGQYIPAKQTFPILCVNHFDNSISSKKTFMEPCDMSFIEEMRQYLHLIPRIYDADCYHCNVCGGYGYECQNTTPWPVYDAMSRLSEMHEIIIGYRIDRCRPIRNGNCVGLCWDGGYFRKWNHKYSKFFKHFLHYCDENDECRCYWPEENEEAYWINFEVFHLLLKLCEKGLINEDFSPFWIAYKYIKRPVIHDEDVYYPSNTGMASSLTTYTFFYSQYHQLLLDIASYIDYNSSIGNTQELDEIYSLLNKIREEFDSLYYLCIDEHPHPKIQYEYGMLKIHSGDVIEGLECIKDFLSFAALPGNNVIITSEVYQQEGQAYADLGMYDQALVALNKALTLDPNNKEAYFSRSQTYFEMGQFDLAMFDYINSNQTYRLSRIKPKYKEEFHSGLLKGLANGGIDGAVDFFPSMLNSAHGITQSLWVFVQHPIDATTNFCNTCYDLCQSTSEFFKDLNWDSVEGYAQELRELYEKFQNIPDQQRGELIGYLIGKYGVDIFAAGTTVKAIELLKNLKNANKICNFEAMLMSKKNREALELIAKEHAIKIQEYFKNIKYNFAAHNKHILGHNDYDGVRSIWTHSNPEGLLKKFAGKGKPIAGIPGEPGYKELVDFGEYIGIWKSMYNSYNKAPTTMGTIHYSKKGAHIVPVHPEKVGQL